MLFALTTPNGEKTFGLTKEEVEMGVTNESEVRGVYEVQCFTVWGVCVHQYDAGKGKGHMRGFKFTRDCHAKVQRLAFETATAMQADFLRVDVFLTYVGPA